MHPGVLVAETQREPVEGAGDRRLPQLARLERIHVRVVGDLADEDLLGRPELLPQQPHTLHLLGAEVPDGEEGPEGLRGRQRADAREQVERLGVLLQHAQRGGVRTAVRSPLRTGTTFCSSASRTPRTPSGSLMNPARRCVAPSTSSEPSTEPSPIQTNSPRTEPARERHARRREPGRDPGSRRPNRGSGRGSPGPPASA